MCQHYTAEPIEFRPRSDSQTSILTYASTEPEDDFPPQPEYEVPTDRPRLYHSTAVPTTPSEFAELFPSSRKLWIAHDDSTSDGNMNLRVDTEALTTSGRKQTMILFHLKMQDLKDRKFQLRRYCRESGREVCSSKRKYAQKIDRTTTVKRPHMHRSLSSALQGLGIKSNAKVPRSNDSGYGSMDNESKGTLEYNISREDEKNNLEPTNTTHLEFSNYAQVGLHRRGTHSAKRYEFEYWGTAYQWQRSIVKDDGVKEVSYELVASEDTEVIAHITPEPLTQGEAREEDRQGGWIPPCTMEILDENIIKASPDIAE